MFKIIVFVLVFMFLFGKIIKYALKYWLMSKINEAQKGFNQQGNFNSHKPNKEGTIKVDYDPRKDGNNNSKSGGEYIDYEEVR